MRQGNNKLLQLQVQGLQLSKFLTRRMMNTVNTFAGDNGQSPFKVLCATLHSEASRNDPKLCICNRPLQDILCRACGYVFTGRARKQCPFHKNSILLMDTACCPKCKVSRLMEFGISKTPTKKVPREETERREMTGLEDAVNGNSVSRDSNMEGTGMEVVCGDSNVEGTGMEVAYRDSSLEIKDHIVCDKHRVGGEEVSTDELSPVKKRMVEDWESTVLTVVKSGSPVKSRMADDVRYDGVRH